MVKGIDRAVRQVEAISKAQSRVLNCLDRMRKV